MDFEKWVSGYKVRVFPWIDGETFYVNVQYFAPGQSIARPPVWEKMAYVTDNERGRRVIQNFLHSLVEHIARMDIVTGNRYILTFE